MKRALLFPGQGSQYVGMGKDLYENFSVARDVFDEVDDVLSEKLTQIIFEGPEDKLKSTVNTQPALMAVSVALIRVIEKELGKPIAQCADFVAGHSLGEYSALCAVGAIGLRDTARLLRIRGQAMQEAVPAGKGGMVALVGVTAEQASTIAQAAASDGVCEVANDNGGGQVVLSGEIAAMDAVVAIASEHGARRAVKLPVSAPFHCSLMARASDVMAQALAEANVVAPSVPVIANVTAESVTEPDSIRELLVRQVTGSVRWRETMENLIAQGTTSYTEIGAGKVLAGLIKRIDKSVESQSIQTVDDLDSFIKSNA